MKYAVDQINDDICKLECLERKEIIYVSKEEFSFDVEEGNIIIIKDNKYYKDSDTEKERRNMLREKMNRLKKRG